MIDLFTKHGKFQMPDAKAISTLEPDQQHRFEAVRAAALEAESAAAATKAAQDHVAQCVSDVRTAEDGLRRVRPKISEIDAARQWINTTR